MGDRHDYGLVGATMHIQATKETGPLYHAAIEKDTVMAIGITNPGEITVSGMKLISNTKSAGFIDLVAAVAIKSSKTVIEEMWKDCEQLIATPWVK
jgi:hypothetical protein